MKPLASFVIPAFNAQKYLAQAILGCREQSEKDIEIIIVNDGSTDGTKELMDWHALDDKRIKAIHLPENKGRSHARNVGNGEARGSFIFVLDSDDIPCKSRVRDALSAFKKQKCDLLYGPFYGINLFGEVTGKATASLFDKELALKRGVNSICHSTMAYKKEVAGAIPYDEGEYSRLGLDDWKFQWDAYLKGYSFGVTLKPLCFYRNTSGNTTNTRNPEEVKKLKEDFLASIR